MYRKIMPDHTEQSVNEVTQQYLDWEAGSATAKDCAADSLGILWTLVSAVRATPWSEEKNKNKQINK